MEPTPAHVPSAATQPATRPRAHGRIQAIARAAGRTCSRPGCGTPAAATLVFSYAEQVARLVELLDAGEPQAYDLCGPHADRTTPPRGWDMNDTRAPRTDTPRSLEDVDTVAVLAAALRGESMPTRVSVLEGGRVDEPAPELPSDAAPDADLDASSDDDPLRAALEEVQRVVEIDAPAVPVTPMVLRAPAEPATLPSVPADEDLTLW